MDTARDVEVGKVCGGGAHLSPGELEELLFQLFDVPNGAQDAGLHQNMTGPRGAEGAGISH
jgi:hypothetical protein